MDTNGRLSNIHPGEVWGEEFLIPLGLSQYVLDKAMAYQRCGSARFVPANGRSLR